MRRTIQTEHVRQHELSDRQVKCFNTAVGMTDGYIAKTGDWITYVETAGDACSQYRTGRMLGSVDAPALISEYPSPEVKGWISVLALSDDLTYAYIRWIKPEDVRGIRKSPPAAFLAWITQASLPDADMVHRLSAYGTLSDRYIDKVDHHINAWKHGVSPAAYDAGVRADKE